VLEMAEKILYNLQKGIVDSTISTAAGLEKEVYILLLIRLIINLALLIVRRHKSNRRFSKSRSKETNHYFFFSTFIT
jgi:hypothetical protein